MIDTAYTENSHILTFENGRTITLVGTAHVSKESVDEVRGIIEERQPDGICLELDDGRLKNKSEKTSWENTDIGKILKEKKGFLMMANLALAGFQKRMGEETGSAPGAEILQGATIAKEMNIPYTLCDRPIQTTFKRAWRKSGFFNKIKLLGELVSAVFSKEEISKEELEELKKSDVMQSMMAEMAKELPVVKEVLIDERDRYLATSIYQSKGDNLVAIIGAGHMNGIISIMKKLEKKEISTDLSDISEIPPASKAGKIATYLIPAAIIAIIASGFINAGWDQGVKMFGYWVGVNALFTGIFSIIALAHPLNVLLSMAAAPFTSLNPTIGVGVVSGILEAKFRKPKIKDFEHLSDDAGHLKMWYKNRILHAFLVFLLASIGSTIGTFIGFPVLLNLLG